MTSSVVSTRPTSKGSALITKHGQKVAHVFFFSFSFVYNNPHSFYHQARDSLFSYYFYIKKKKKIELYILCERRETDVHSTTQTSPKKKTNKRKRKQTRCICPNFQERIGTYSSLFKISHALHSCYNVINYDL